MRGTIFVVDELLSKMIRKGNSRLEEGHDALTERSILTSRLLISSASRSIATRSKSSYTRNALTRTSFASRSAARSSSSTVSSVGGVTFVTCKLPGAGTCLTVAASSASSRACRLLSAPADAQGICASISSWLLRHLSWNSYRGHLSTSVLSPMRTMRLHNLLG